MNEFYEKRVLIDTNKMIWDETNNKDIFKKLLSKKENEETSILKIEKNGKINTNSKINSVEIFVLEGTYINEFGKFNKGTYLYLPKEDEVSITSNDACTIFRKINYLKNDEQIIIDTNCVSWLSGQGNLEVMPLSTQTALVKWPKDEKFMPHKHWGGEEVFVLKGTFMDEHGAYPEGSWIRSPHLSVHFPYVKEETIIFVKTGHL
uniref:cupin domain-containing protein n=1 Tax=Aliarcobacter sp. TaxID=2321116 RepID=UPI00404733AA